MSGKLSLKDTSRRLISVFSGSSLELSGCAPSHNDQEASLCEQMDEDSCELGSSGSIFPEYTYEPQSGQNVSMGFGYTDPHIYSGIMFTSINEEESLVVHAAAAECCDSNQTILSCVLLYSSPFTISDVW